MQRLYTLLSGSFHRNEKSPYYRSGALGAQSPSLIILFPCTSCVTSMDLLAWCALAYKCPFCLSRAIG
jgi:hypothetical protein